MSGLINAVVIGAISQLLMYNINKDTFLDTKPDFNKIIYFALSVFAIQTVFNLITKNNKTYKLLIEAAAVGILTVIIGKLTMDLVINVFEQQGLPPKYLMETTFILTGVFIHLFCEFTGINKWYTVNGVAALY
jgi:hypothetical protein